VCERIGEWYFIICNTFKKMRHRIAKGIGKPYRSPRLTHLSQICSLRSVVTSIFTLTFEPSYCILLFAFYSPKPIAFGNYYMDGDDCHEMGKVDRCNNENEECD